MMFAKAIALILLALCSGPAEAWTHGVAAHNGFQSQVNSPSAALSSAQGTGKYLNAFKDAGRWTNITGGAGVDLTRLDANGYATSLPTNGINANVNLPATTSTWLLLWDGGGTMSSTGSLVGGSYTGGSAEINFGTSGGTVGIRVLAVNSPSDYPNNIRLVMNNGTDPGLLAAGRVFRPGYIDYLSRAGIVRMLDPQSNNVNTTVFWADRKPETYYSWSTYYFPPSKVVPIANVTYDGVSKYTVTWSGQTGPLTDKTQFLAQVPTSGGVTTTNLNGTGDITNGSFWGGTRSSLTALRWMLWTYDSELNVWMIDDVGEGSGTGISTGAPIEALIQEAIVARAHLWVIPPVYASDYNGGISDFTAGMAALIKASLSGGLQGIFECGPNEIFNPASKTTQFAYRKGSFKNGGFSAYTVTSATAGATTRLTIGTNTTQVGSLLTFASVGGLSGISGAFRVLSKPTATEIIVSASTTGTYTSGGTATPVQDDYHNWYGIACSKNAQAWEAVYGASNKGVTYRIIAGFQAYGNVSALGSNSGSSARIESPFLTVNGNTSQAAYNFLTGISAATYFQPGYAGSNVQMTIVEGKLAFEYTGATAGRKTAILNEYATSTTLASTPITILGVTPGNPTVFTVDRTDLLLVGDVGGNGANDVISIAGTTGNISAVLNRTFTNSNQSPTINVLSKTATTITADINTTGLVWSGGGTIATKGTMAVNITNNYAYILPQFITTYATPLGLEFMPYEGGSAPDRQTSTNSVANIKGITNGATTVINVGANSWDYLYNTVGLTGMTTGISGIAAGTLATLLNGNTYTILSATATTITINVDTSAVSAWVSGGFASYVGSTTAVNVLRELVNFTPDTQTLTVENATQFRAMGAAAKYPSEFNFSTQQNYSMFYPNYLDLTLVPYRYYGMLQYNFLLKRDLDPASNDNDPMWLEKAA